MKVKHLFALLILFGATFVFGYMVGAGKAQRLERSISAMKTELASKTSGLEHSLKRARIRINLIEARDRLEGAVREVELRNFGKAQGELEAALSNLETTTEVEPELVTRVRPLVNRLDLLRRGIETAGAAQRGAIEQVRGHVERLLAEQN